MNTDRIAERIADEDGGDQRSHRRRPVLRDGHVRSVAAELVKSSDVAVESALESSSSLHDFQLMLAQVGISLSRED